MVRCLIRITTGTAVALFLSLASPGANAATPQPAHSHAPSAAVRSTAVIAADIVRNPSEVPPPIGDRPPAVVPFTLTVREMVGQLDSDSGATYTYWTFDGTVPGPMLRVLQGDTVEITMRSASGNHMPHSIDLHAAIGDGGGAALTQTLPGGTNTFSFVATTAGLFVYHCGTPVVAEHIANGMYGLILVEPRGGLPAVDREFYVVQGEIYTAAAIGTGGIQKFALQKLLDEHPEYLVFNGAVGALMKEHPMKVRTGETVRIFFGNAGPNLTSSPHVMGEIFTRVYSLGSVTSPALTDVQTASVPPGGAAILEFKAPVPGEFGLVDHAIARAVKGLMAHFEVTGEPQADLIHAGSATPAATPAVVGESASEPSMSVHQHH